MLPSTVTSSPGLLLDERMDADGTCHRMDLRARAAEVLELEEDGVVLGALPALAVRVTMLRYGRELEPGLEVTGPELPVGPGVLRRYRFRAAVDAIGRDYLVWSEPGRPPVATLATTVAAALRHLVAAAPR